ncbi:hypothetical protein FJT64_026000 [Amphibalanus amphitrite]|uniref:Uncharacterized protein n=1 Tax=Amphibalanus amphitrite TaxID=1232801 RepID=A0A6A4WI62_AMPAM|nr:hypothetical protein FJT64_026000 [Amphibalanus amphitrite]
MMIGRFDVIKCHRARGLARVAAHGIVYKFTTYELRVGRVVAVALFAWFVTLVHRLIDSSSWSSKSIYYDGLSGIIILPGPPITGSHHTVAGRAGLRGRGAAAHLRGVRGRRPVPADAAAAGGGLRARLVRSAAAGPRPSHVLPAVRAARHTPRVQPRRAGAAHLQVSPAPRAMGRPMLPRCHCNGECATLSTGSLSISVVFGPVGDSL